MMRTREHLKLRQIAAIQGLKADAAEARLADATREVRHAERSREEAQIRCEASVQAWQASVAVHGLTADVTAFWSDAIRQDDNALFNAAQRLDQQETVVRACENAFRHQLNARDAASEVARSAHQRMARKREEAQLHEVNERLALKWSRS